MSPPTSHDALGVFNLMCPILKGYLAHGNCRDGNHVLTKLGTGNVRLVSSVATNGRRRVKVSEMYNLVGFAYARFPFSNYSTHNGHSVIVSQGNSLLNLSCSFTATGRIGPHILSGVGGPTNTLLKFN